MKLINTCKKRKRLRTQKQSGFECFFITHILGNNVVQYNDYCFLNKNVGQDLDSDLAKNDQGPQPKV